MEPLTTATATVVGILVGYLTGYAKKKGENLATHEDIGKLTDQVAAVTKTAKEIEAQISSDVWDRQKRWELKREVLFEATRRLAEVDDALRSLSTTLRMGRRERLQDNDLAWGISKKKSLTRWTKASAAFDETRLFVGVVCGQETRKAFDGLGGIVLSIAAGTVDDDVYDSLEPELRDNLFIVREAIRKELGIDAPGQTELLGSA